MLKRYILFIDDLLTCLSILMCLYRLPGTCLSIFMCLYHLEMALPLSQADPPQEDSTQSLGLSGSNGFGCVFRVYVSCLFVLGSANFINLAPNLVSN